MRQTSFLKNDDYIYATSIPCNQIREMSTEAIEEIIGIIIDYYYEHGFPYYGIDVNKMRKEYMLLSHFDVSTLELHENQLQQNMLGLRTVNSFHDEMWSTQCRSAKTPMDVFNNRDLFAEALRKRIKYSDTKLRPFNIRKSLKAFGVQAVSNFRPTIAKWVYERYAPDGSAVLDPCMGYGGRLFGAYCSHIGCYYGTDPNKEAYNGNTAMLNLLEEMGGGCKKIHLYNEPFEDFDIGETFDLVFTSPPYFDIEKYSDQNETQSYIRYPEYEQWVEKFLTVLIEKSYGLLKTGGYLALNVGSPIIEDTQRIGNKIFGKPEVYHMRLSKILGNGDKKNISHKTEPIFIWRKE